MSKQLYVFAYGGGVQSTAALVLAAQERIPYRVFVFANVGDDSERADTLRYVRDVAMPFAATHGIELVEVRRVMVNVPQRTLYQETVDPTLASIPIPTRMSDGAPGLRSCTQHFKIKVIGKEVKRRGASKANPAMLGLGISTDEYQRMGTSRIAWQVNDYPLIDLRLSRNDCHRIIYDAGLDSPGKSSCWFCPFYRLADWQRMRQHEPEIFQQCVDFEALILEKCKRLGKPPRYLSRRGMPLDQAIPNQAVLPLDNEHDDFCESGHCMT